MELESLTIGQVAQQTGVSTSALRYYERVRVIPQAERRSGRRVYDREAVLRVRSLQLAQRAGLRLDEIRRLFRRIDSGQNPPDGWRELAPGKYEELDAQMRKLEARKRVLDALMTCECPTVEECGSAAEGRGCSGEL